MMPDQSRMPPLRALLLAVLPVLTAAVLGNLATTPNIPTWYAGLDKPDFNPPNWVFGPAWGMLYILMAYAFFRVLRLDPKTPGRKAAIGLFLFQMVLNAAWSWAFFAAHSPLAGLVVISALWIAIAATLFSFLHLDRIAGLCFVPYIAWVSFAALLNFEIYRLN
ncbi:TspO/MBR family protein [Iodidimonas sp. SYSU 1G8]|uniref:TspO/MBR family protein n=1 Tax=Iodidimonas sp. SYSU 1G8 TaxID=3133967 RepID=UPI0031FF1F4F